MEQAKIRKVAIDDIDDCQYVIRKAFLPKVEQYGFTKETYPSSGAFIEKETLIDLFRKNTMMYIVCIDEKIVGYFQLLEKEDREYLFQKFAVLPEYQKFGVGRMLINFAKEKTKELGGKKLSLIMINDNADLKRFYISNGFEVGEVKNDNKYPFEQAVMVWNNK